MKRVDILLPDQLYEKVKKEVENGNYSTISDVVRTALRKLLSEGGK
jgi:Arc/MetJ-type ribon-helix-helix transcriptional regulator